MTSVTVMCSYTSESYHSKSSTANNNKMCGPERQHDIKIQDYSSISMTNFVL